MNSSETSDNSMEHGHPRNLPVDHQQLYGANNYRKNKYGHHSRSLSETVMFCQIKK
ncbi:transposase and inactivated derivative [Vibrio vulnificus YJ016]|uniref:Transposase and inactivated derivative n=1 Tax=Vibrio vulnificus (strain YJ016) TaxID=196600 RepID=Q7MKP3_VIBVY|nr:transposase and inactivated derivative [Vibrio vulnificus YJ016]